LILALEQSGMSGYGQFYNNRSSGVFMAEQQDITAATGTYSDFLKLLKIGTIGVVIVAATVVLIIAR
jgi:hypothetical protein